MAILPYSAIPLTEPSGTQALTSAASWLQGTMLGSVATIVAVLAVAAVGVGMFRGRVDIRRGLIVVVGCFVLFGSASIANAMMTLIGASPSTNILASAEVAPSPLATLPAPEPVPYDPYAGASVSRR